MYGAGEVMSTSSRTRRVCWHVTDRLVAGILGLVLILLGPFNLDEVTAKASRDVFYRAWSVAYPQDGRPKIGVILLGDNDLRQSGWPAPYSTHAAALQSLAKFAPRAVAIDLVFIDERKDETIADLVEAIKKLAATGIPVYLASASDNSGAPRALRRELQQLVDARTAYLVDVSVADKSGSTRPYFVSAPSGGALPLSAALYKDLCKSNPASDCIPSPSLNKFELWWAAPPPPANCAETAQAADICSHVSSSPIARALSLTINGMFGKLSPLQEADPIAIAPFPTLNWTALRTNNFSVALRRAFEGSIVFYGADIAYARDTASNPVYGGGGDREIAGVYHHAMALDNLLALQGNVIREAAISDSAHSALLVVGFALVSLVARLFAGDRIGPRGAKTLDKIVWATSAVIIAYIEFTHLRISPGNWIGALLAVYAGSMQNGLLNKATRTVFSKAI